MPWVRFDDQFPIHRKVTGLSDKTYRLHTEAIFWCARNLTDGHISCADLRQICAKLRSGSRHVDELLKPQLWHQAGDVCPSEKCPAPVIGDGWVIHDYWAYQPSKARVIKDREATARRQADWRAAHQGDSNAVTNTVTNAVNNTVSNGTPGPARPSSGSAVTEPAGRHHRPPVENPYSNGQSRPGDSPAARHPSARPLAAALEDAHVNGKPADDDTIQRLAALARRGITNPEGTTHEH